MRRSPVRLIPAVISSNCSNDMCSCQRCRRLRHHYLERHRIASTARKYTKMGFYVCLQMIYQSKIEIEASFEVYRMAICIRHHVGVSAIRSACSGRGP